MGDVLKLDHAAFLFRHLADVTRLRLLAELVRSGESSAVDLARRVKKSRGVVGNHLTTLMMAGIVERRMERGRWYYQFTRQFIEGRVALDLLRQICPGSFAEPDRGGMTASRG